MTLLWLTGYAWAVARARPWVRREGLQRALDAVLGATLVALGVHIALERR